MARALDLGNISTRLQRIERTAKEKPELVFTSLAHNIDLFFLYEAMRRTRKDSAPGVDGVSWRDYEGNWQENLARLKEAFKSGRYKAPPSQRSYIPKPDGKPRPIALPTLEDKILQRAVAMLLGVVYEQDFYDFSYGFRPGKSAHGAVSAVRETLHKLGGGWVLEVDIKGYFDTISHQYLRGFLDQRVRDGVIRRSIDKWLKAGILEDGVVRRPETGTPQGGVISPLLANIYLHEVLDKWFVKEVRPRMRGWSHIFRFADDFIIIFQDRKSAERAHRAIEKRFQRFELTVHPEKTKLVDFRKPGKPDGRADTFSFLGFTFYWGKSQRGYWVIKRKTSNKSFNKSTRAIREWCRKNRHRPLKEQQRKLSQKLMGHFAYFGIRGNYEMIKRYHRQVNLAWKKWLSRRSQKSRDTWKEWAKIMARHQLPPPKIIHWKV